jgi:hypothetical protein
VKRLSRFVVAGLLGASLVLGTVGGAAAKDVDLWIGPITICYPEGYCITNYG